MITALVVRGSELRCFLELAFSQKNAKSVINTNCWNNLSKGRKLCSVQFSTDVIDEKMVKQKSLKSFSLCEPSMRCQGKRFETRIVGKGDLNQVWLWWQAAGRRRNKKAIMDAKLWKMCANFEKRLMQFTLLCRKFQVA